MKAKFPCDLHGHTNRSDGNDSLIEFIEKAAKRGVKVAAVTDHDMAPLQYVEVEGERVDAAAFAKAKGVCLLSGIEISCETEIEDVHMVCFGCDWSDKYFRQLEEQTIKSKYKSYRQLVEALNAHGMQMTWGEILDCDGISIEESQVQKKMIFEMMAKKGYAPSWKDAKLMVKQRPLLNVKREKPRAVDTIGAIHRLGGIVILAHPYLIAEKVSYENQIINRGELIERFISAGLDGIEASYTYDKTSYDGQLLPGEIYGEILRRYGNRGLIISGGSDYHGDGKKGVHNPREIGECGITLEAFKDYSNTTLHKFQ